MLPREGRALFWDIAVSGEVGENVVEGGVEAIADCRVFPAIGAEQYAAELDDIEFLEFVRQVVSAESIAGDVRQRDGARVDVAERRFLLLFAAVPSLVAAAMLRLVDSDQDRYFETICSADHRLYPLPR